MALLARSLEYQKVGRFTFLAARGEFEASIAMYDKLGDAIEAAISRGFLGRYYLVTSNRRQAVKLLRHTHRSISGKNDSGERDNIVWLARASFWWRWYYVLRALQVTAGTRRREEYIALLKGGELFYERYRARQDQWNKSR